MKRVALYARYSTDLQNDRSIDDQLALCRAYAARHDLAIVAEFNDRAISGASIQNRPGIKTLMAAAQAGGFDVVLVEQLDRVSRDQVDLPAVWRDLRHAGVELVAVHGGEADVVQIGVRALVGALFLQDLADKVRRGLAGVAREGRSAGGISYGYRQVAGGRRGEREIDPDQAAIVRRIAREYTAGRTPREIAAGLNRDQVPPPRDGGRWNGSTIYGSPKRGTGILHNELYAGRLIWNRLRMVRDPNTGRRISRINPASEHQVVAVPHLAILDDRTW
ncbi:MAG: recombinase family protein, partial [Alphaproteobacteria bacterium]